MYGVNPAFKGVGPFSFGPNPSANLVSVERGEIRHNIPSFVKNLTYGIKTPTSKVAGYRLVSYQW